MIVSASQAAFPGKNGLIVFESSSPIVHGTSTGGSEIFVMNANGSGQHSLTPDPENGASNPSISPNGQKIAFASDGQIFLMDADGSHQRPLTHTSGFKNCPSFSPTGRKIIYVASRGIWEMNVNGSHQHRLNPTESCPSVSPDGKIAFIKITPFGGHHEGSEIIVMKANGSHPRVVLRTREHDFNPSFSPDGRKIVFTGNSPEKDVFVINTDGSHLRQLTHHPRFDECPAFSPNGRKIVYVQKTRTRPRRPQIWVMNANGSHKHRLTHDTREDFCPQWGPRAR